MVSFQAAAFAISLAAVALSSGHVGADEAIASPIRQGFDLVVPHAPTVVRIGTQQQLRYELHLTNLSTRSLSLASIEIIDDGSGRSLGRLEGRALGQISDVPGSEVDVAQRGTVEPGRRLVVYVDLELSGPPPSKLRHKIDFSGAGSDSRAVTEVVAGRVALDQTSLPILDPPLRGGPWVAVYHPTLERGHRRVIYAVAGRAVIPGRFAIDWMPAGPSDGRSTGLGFGEGRGADALAVTDGVVVGARDEFPEPMPGVARPSVPLADATGNYVALELQSGRVAFYEHLSPGLAVKIGDRVRRGQIIGRIGSTGSASRPHLHFHLADANSPLGAEGIPYTLRGATHVGAYGSVQESEAAGSWRAQLPSALDGFPPPNAIVVFRPEAKSSARSSGAGAVRKPHASIVHGSARSPVSVAHQRAAGRNVG